MQRGQTYTTQQYTAAHSSTQQHSARSSTQQHAGTHNSHAHHAVFSFAYFGGLVMTQEFFFPTFLEHTKCGSDCAHR